MPPVLEPHHLCGVNIGVASLAGVCCPGPLFHELVVLQTDMEKEKAVRFLGLIVARGLSAINDWRISRHFLLLFPLSLRANNDVDRYV